VFVRAVFGWYRRRARRAGWADGHSGSVTMIQRFGSGLQLNVHGHALVLDGVFTEAADSTLRFHPAAAPTDLEVAWLVATIRRRVLRLLWRRGIFTEATGSGAIPVVAIVHAGDRDRRARVCRRSDGKPHWLENTLFVSNGRGARRAVSLTSSAFQA
jgi:hypothetical protein